MENIIQNHDYGTIIAILGASIANIAVMISLFLWIRSEANADRRDIHNTQANDRKDLLQLNRNIEKAVEAIQWEMKDFHGKIYILQQKGK